MPKRSLNIVTASGRVWGFSPAVELAAKQILADQQISERASGVYATKTRGTRPEVKTAFLSEPHARYQFVTCTCSHAKTSGFGRARCRHVLAALLFAFGGVEQ